MKLAPGADFTNILHMQIQKAQKIQSSYSLFSLLGSADIKALCKMLVKLTPEDDLVNFFLLKNISGFFAVKQNHISINDFFSICKKQANQKTKKKVL